MGLRISGKSVDVGDSFRSLAEGRIGEALEKYFDGGFSGHITVEREGSGFKTECMIHLDTGIVLQAEGRGQDVHQSFDQAAERIEKRLRRYKRRLKEHHHHSRHEDTIPATEYVIAAPDEDDEATPEDPTIIAEQTTDLETMTVGSAVMAMDLTDAQVKVFRHAGHGGVNIVYRRSDGHIGWIDPSLGAKRETAKH
ncbi:MAG TPA: ribosome-associated translation inhibitor RaiA [Bauldia sp.]|nr:ribosome-associated translation inhibitor RaiA [Bauldia sp.]